MDLYDPDREGKTLMTDYTIDRYAVNDALTGMLSDHGFVATDTELNDLSHQVADMIEAVANHRRPAKLRFWQSDEDGTFWWTLTDTSNGKIIGGSTEGYENLSDAAHNFRLGRSLPVVVDDESLL
jgi:hypothetical protein